MQLLTVLGRPSNASFNPQIRQWAANEVVPAALEACLGANVMASTGTAIVTMIKEFHDFDYLKTSHRKTSLLDTICCGCCYENH